MSINTAILNGERVTRETFQFGDMFKNEHSDFREWMVGLDWTSNVHLGNNDGSGVCYGIYAKPHVICSLDNQKYLRAQLQKSFGIDFKNLLPDYKD